MGITFKEDCPDTRNTKVVDIYHELREFGLHVDVFDPWANADEVKHEYGIPIHAELPQHIYDGIIVAVAHQVFSQIDLLAVKGR
jgi:UDP-N-acetyl-D-galactosamine dehydrogenase